MVAYNQEIMESLSDYTGNFNERVMAYLEEQGISRSSYNEMLRNYLLAEGYEGYTLNELIRNVDGGLAQLFAAVKRYILNLNGTQYVKLDSKITIAGECEIEWFCTWPELEGSWFFADTTNDDVNASRFLTHSGNISGLGFPSSTPLSTAPEPGLISRLNYKRSSSGDVSFSVNGEVLATTTYSGPIVLNSFFTKWSGPTGITNYSGNVFSIEIKQAGVTTNYWPLDDNSGVLRDTTGDNNGTIINYVTGDWEEISKKSGDDFWLGADVATLLSADNVESGWSILSDSAALIETSNTNADPRFIDFNNVLIAGYEYYCKFTSSDFSGSLTTGFSINSFETNPLSERALTDNGEVSSVLVATSPDLLFFAFVDGGTGSAMLSDLSVRRYIKYAEGTLVEPEEPVGSFGTAPMEIDSELASLFSTVAGGSPATDVVLEPTTATITNPNEGSTVLSAIRSTVVSTAPVYFELDVEAPDGHTEEEIQFSPTVNLDGDNQVAVLLGGVSSVEAGESVELALGNNGISANLYRASPSIVSYPFASGETSASVGVVRLGIAYDPSAGTYTIYAWTTGGATFQYPTASDVSTVVEFGPYNLHPQETANHFSTTTAVGVPDTVVGGVVYRIVTDEADFSNPEGKPAGYVDLASAAGGDTAPHTLPFLANSPF